MVQIRSGRWYSGENQKELRRRAPSNSNGTRRLLSLVLLLALVVVLMAKISDPSSMRRAFDALGIPLDQKPVASTHPATDSSAANSSVTLGGGDHERYSLGQPANIVTDTPWDKTCADLVPRMLERISPEQIDRLAEYWFATAGSRNSSATSQELLGLDSASLIQSLKEKLDETSDEFHQWSDLLAKFDNRWQAMIVDCNRFHSEADEPSADARLPVDEFHHHVSTNLDLRLLSNLRDASPWTSAETVGFGRLLQRGKYFKFGSVDPPLLATEVLEREFSKLRGSWVRYRGTVRLIESIQREQPLVDQAGYSLLWLRGFDGSTQPIAVYTTSSIVDQLQRSISDKAFPEIEVVGLVGKKLVYGSASGVQVTPTLFAGSIVQYASDLVGQGSGQNPALSRQFGVTAIAGVVLCLIACGFVWKQLRSNSANRATRSSFKLSLGLMVSATLTMGLSLAQEPPWKSSSAEAEIKSQVVQQRLLTAFDPQQIQQIEQLIQGNDTAPPNSVLRVLFALNEVGWSSTWQIGNNIELQSGYELKPAELTGWAWSVQPLSLTPNQQEWFSAQPVKNIYRLQVQLQATLDQHPPQLVTVFCKTVPKLWKESAQLKQPIQLKCYSFSRSQEALPVDSQPVVDKAADRMPDLSFYIAEYPAWKIGETDQTMLETLHPTIPANWLELAKLGWDLAWFDQLAANNQKRLSIAETEPLLQMLQISRQSGTSVAKAVSPIDAMRQPLDHLAAPIDWQVRLVSGSVVQLTHEGATIQYYQIDGFVKIPNQTVNYTIPDSGQSVTFNNEFPVTIITSADRQFVPLEELRGGAQSWQIGKTARVQGRFLRLWSYESQRLSTAELSSRQVAPLIVAGQLEEVSAIPPVAQESVWTVALLTAAMLAVMLYVLRNVLKKPTRKTRR